MLRTPTRLLPFSISSSREAGREEAQAGTWQVVGQLGRCDRLQPGLLPSLTAFRVSPPAHQKQNTRGRGSPGGALGPQLPLEEQTDAGLPGSRR